MVAQMVRNMLAMMETQIWSLGQEDPLEKGMATHSSILVWRIPWTEEPGRLQSIGSQRVGQDLATEKQQLKILFMVIYVKIIKVESYESEHVDSYVYI